MEGQGTGFRLGKREAEPWTGAWRSSSLERRKPLEEETVEGVALTPFPVLSLIAAGAEPPSPGHSAQPLPAVTHCFSILLRSVVVLRG